MRRRKTRKKIPIFNYEKKLKTRNLEQKKKLEIKIAPNILRINIVGKAFFSLTVIGNILLC